MDNDDLDGSRQIRGKNADYKFFWSVFNKEDFDTWFERFKSTKKWQEKYVREDRNKKMFTWFIHNTLRSKKTCEYSISENNFCGARLKVPTSADKEGRYILELNEDGCEHFLSEFYPTFHEVTMSEASNSDSLNSDQSQIVDESNEWEQLANRFMENMKISASKTLTKSQLQRIQCQPQSIISVSEKNEHIDWGLLKSNTQLQMVFARCTLGPNRDSEFLDNFSAMVAARLPQLGVWHHFFGGLNSPTAEKQFEIVNNVLSEVGFNKRRDLFAIAIQTEYNSDFAPLYFTAQLIKFISLLRKANFMRPIIYCNNNSWNSLIDHSDTNAEEQFSKLPLWIASYDNANPTYPETWRSRGIPWWMWNYTHSGSLNGIINHVNFNKRNESCHINDKYFHSNV